MALQFTYYRRFIWDLFENNSRGVSSPPCCAYGQEKRDLHQIGGIFLGRGGAHTPPVQREVNLGPADLKAQRRPFSRSADGPQIEKFAHCQHEFAAR